MLSFCPWFSVIVCPSPGPFLCYLLHAPRKWLRYVLKALRSRFWDAGDATHSSDDGHDISIDKGEHPAHDADASSPPPLPSPPPPSSSVLGFNLAELNSFVQTSTSSHAADRMHGAPEVAVSSFAGLKKMYDASPAASQRRNPNVCRVRLVHRSQAGLRAARARPPRPWRLGARLGCSHHFCRLSPTNSHAVHDLTWQNPEE